MKDIFSIFGGVVQTMVALSAIFIFLGISLFLLIIGIFIVLPTSPIWGILTIFMSFFLIANVVLIGMRFVKRKR